MLAYLFLCCDGEHSIRGYDRRHSLHKDILRENEAFTEPFYCLLVALLLLDVTFDDDFPLVHSLHGYLTAADKVLHVHYDLK